MTVSVRLNAQDEKLFRDYAKSNNITMSELFRNAVLEKIEDEYDLKVYQEAIEEYRRNPVTYSFDEVRKHCGLDD